MKEERREGRNVEKMAAERGGTQLWTTG